MSNSGILTTPIGQYTDDYYQPGGEEAVIATLLGVYAIVIVFAVVFALASYVVLSIGLAGLFRKAGIESWKAWVPFYSTYIWLQLGGQNGHWIWATLIPYGSIVTSIFLYIGMHRTGKAFGKETGFLVLGIFLPWVWVLILGLGKDEYHPERITAAGLGGPLVGYGAGSRPGYQPGAYPPAAYQGGAYPPAANQGGAYPSNGYAPAGQTPPAYQPPAYQPAAGQVPPAPTVPPIAPVPTGGPAVPSPTGPPVPTPTGPQVPPSPTAPPVPPAPTGGPVPPAPTSGPTPGSPTPPSLSKE
jgi:hypothetical protein